MCRLQYIAMSDNQESVTTGQTDGQTDTGQSDPYVPLCFAGDTKTGSGQGTKIFVDGYAQRTQTWMLSTLLPVKFHQFENSFSSFWEEIVGYLKINDERKTDNHVITIKDLSVRSRCTKNKWYDLVFLHVTTENTLSWTVRQSFWVWYWIWT